MTLEQGTQAKSGAGSFCVPRIALEALIEAQASAYEICAYLTLARFTDETGIFSTASISAVNSYTGANKVKGGPIDRAIERLKSIKAKTVKKVTNGRTGRQHSLVEHITDLGPILYDRAAWVAGGLTLPDGPHERAKVLHVLPDFAEPISDRVWIGNNLVSGVASFNQPLKALKNAGDVAARLLLRLYSVNDMELWGGVRPVGALSGPNARYEPVDEDVHLVGNARLIRSKKVGKLAQIEKGICPGDKEAYWNALTALESAGLIYEVVMVLNRNARKAQFANGDGYEAIPDDSEPYYELDARSLHGYKPEGETGLGGITARTAGELGWPVTLQGGVFDGTYAAIVPSGFGAMVTGIYRLRFRVANAKNAGVKGAWARVHQNNKDALDFIQKVRAANGLEALPPPG